MIERVTVEGRGLGAALPPRWLGEGYDLRGRSAGEG
jgi:hypothetical protein